MYDWNDLKAFLAVAETGSTLSAAQAMRVSQTTVARRIVVPPHRDGGQAQFIERPVPECAAETFGPLLEWIVGHLDEDLDVPTLARKSLMSPRTFARKFRAETGATPHAWVTQQRVLRAEQLLEETDQPVEWIADHARCNVQQLSFNEVMRPGA